MDLFRNKLEMKLNTLLLAELTKFYPSLNTMLVAIIQIIFEMDITNILYILF